MQTSNTKKTQEYYKHVSLFWTDLLSLMASKPYALSSAGPMRKFGTNMKKLSTELIEANDDLLEFNTRLSEYYKQLTDTWTEAQKQFNKKVPELPNDAEHIEASKRVWIDIFENYFTTLFDSTKFAENFGKLVSSELELAKHWNSMMSVLLDNANLPTKDDINEVYKELHSLKKRIAKMEKDSNHRTVKRNGK